jgi:Fuc2NAc and GlcNAc transferase
MDGIDGIAGVEGVYVGFAGGALMLLNPADSGLSGISLAFGAACAGFLVWNWAPARIFMGDVGSGFVGYVIAVLAVAGAFVDPASLFVWLILGGTFFVDATVTLVLRLARGERLHLAHRSHFYQRLARTWGSHAKVSLAVAAVNVVWLLPWAVAAKLRPSSAVWFALAALLPLIVIVIAGGAGRAETVER